MKTLITTTLFALLSISALWGQSHSNVTFFAVEGEPFTLVLNGKKINKTPESSVTDTNVASRINVKIIFEDTDLGEIADNFYLNYEYQAVSFKIEANKKGIYKIKRDAYDALPRPKPVFTPPPPNPQQIIVIEGNGSTTLRECYVADDEVLNIIKLIQKEIGTTSKLETAMTIIRNKNQCLTALQIRQLITLFSFDSDRLTLAKYGYDYAKDRPNYYTVGEVLSFFKKQEFMLFLATK
jgi:hypothetical protein